MPQVRPYDFRQPPRRLPTLTESFHATLAHFAGGLGISLSAHTRARVEIELERIEPLRYDDFMGSRAVCACLCVLRIDPPGLHAILDLSPAAIFSVIDRLLCGNADESGAIPARPLTHIERILANQIVERAAAQLADTFSSGGRVQVDVEELITDPVPLHLMPADEVAAVAQFSVRVNDGGGTMSLCLPYPLLDHLAAADAPANTPQQDEANLRANVLRADVELRVVLAETKLRLGDVLSMEVGDIITTEHLPQNHVPVQVQGRTKFVGQIGQLHGNLAIEITSSSSGSGE